MDKETFLAALNTCLDWLDKHEGYYMTVMISDYGKNILVSPNAEGMSNDD